MRNAVIGCVPRRLAVIALAWVAGCSASTWTPSSRTATTHVVQRGTVTRHLLLTGELDAVDATVFVTPRTENFSARIRFLADDGSSVKAGDQLIAFDDAPLREKLGELRLAVAQARSDLDVARAEAQIQLEDKRFALAQARTDLHKARLDADVDPDLVSRSKLREAELAVIRAQATLATAQDDLAATEKASALEERIKLIAVDTATRRLDAAQAQLEELEIVAPRDGVFIVEQHFNEDRKVQAGDEMWPGLPIAKLPDLSRLVVNAQLSDVDHGQLSPGQTALCTLDAYPEQQWPGTIQSVGPVARARQHQGTRRFFPVVVELASADPTRMLPGLSVLVDVELDRHDDVLVLPRAAVAPDATTSVRLTDGREVDVSVGPCDAQVCAISSGLTEGDEVAEARRSR